MSQRKQEHQATLQAVKEIVNNCLRLSPPSYRHVSARLNYAGLTTTYGNPWTPARLYKFLFRMGYSGLHGVKAEQQGRPRKLP